jgi:hypothetical protein
MRPDRSMEHYVPNRLFVESEEAKRWLMEE